MYFCVYLYRIIKRFGIIVLISHLCEMAFACKYETSVIKYKINIKYSGVRQLHRFSRLYLKSIRILQINNL